MLVDINLLPEKETKRLSIVVPLIVVLLALLGIASFLWIQTMKNELALTESQLQTTVQLRETLEASANEPQGDQQDAEKLKEAVQWAEGKKLQLVPVLQHIIALLPERGFLLEANYADNETLNVTVQFDTNREAAYYLSELEASEWISHAEILALNTSVQEDEKDAKELLKKMDALPRYGVEFKISLNKAFVLQKQEEAQKGGKP